MEKESPNRTYLKCIKILNDTEKRRREQFSFFQYKNKDHPIESLNSASKTKRNTFPHSTQNIMEVPWDAVEV